jgi:carbonic anhydrase
VSLKANSILVGALSASLIAVTAVAGSGHGHWGYSGHSGPEHWAELNSDFATCKSGTRQSPIDINRAQLMAAQLDDIRFDYRAISPEIINNGHTIQVNYANGSAITMNDEQFQLAQFHFHTPSENTVNGKPFDMEMHLVHKNVKGELAVVGVFFKKGKHNANLEKLWDNMPAATGEKKNPAATRLNAEDLLPQNRTYVHFNGSLTTPPCSEGVNWYVMNEPMEASAEQIARFAGVIGQNARPVQQLNNRFVLGQK